MDQFGGGESGGDLAPDFQKRGRFDNPEQPESELDRLDAPPATLRILVRQIDAGGIIGKVCRGALLLAYGSWEWLTIGKVRFEWCGRWWASW